MDQTKDAPIYLPTADDYRDLAHFTRWRIEPYAFVYISFDDFIVLKVWSPSAASTVNVSLRVQMTDGRIMPTFYSFNVPATAGTPAQLVVEQMEGFILSATVETPNAPAGQCYVQLQMARGRGTGDQTMGQLLCAGYPGQGFAIGFPQTPAGSPTGGPGQAVTATVANPAAGADWTYTVPAGVQLTLISVRAVLTTSAAVANRVPLLRVTNPTAQIILDAGSPTTQAASLTYTYSWGAGAQSAASPPSIQIGIPQGLRVAAGATIQTVTAGIQAADQWSAITISSTQFVSA